MPEAQAEGMDRHSVPDHAMLFARGSVFVGVTDCGPSGAALSFPEPIRGRAAREPYQASHSPPVSHGLVPAAHSM